MHQMNPGMKLIINEMEGLQHASKCGENLIIIGYRVST